MALDTNTKKSEAGKKPRFLIPGLFRLRKSRRPGSLTVKILTVNMIAPLVLVFGVLYMGQYRDTLIGAELETLKAQTQLFAGAVAESAVKPAERGIPFLFAKPEEIEVLIPELSRRMLRHLGEKTRNRARLFDRRGNLIGDSQQLMGDSQQLTAKDAGPVEVVSLAPGQNSAWTLAYVLRYLAENLLHLVPTKNDLKLYPSTTSKIIDDYPDALKSLTGQPSATAWRNHHGDVVLSASAPVVRSRQIMGVVMLTRDGMEIETAMTQVRFDVLTVFLGALSVTIFLSLYLANMIGRPLKKLATAAESVRQGKGRQMNIPDFSSRNDEIGELSVALRGMTKALWDRMDTIERFAADVAHEIKNPLTSLRSAVETVAKVKNQKDQDRLMEIIQHDVIRLDRLISDISNASRLDAELSRDEQGTVDLHLLLEQLVAFTRTYQERQGGDETHISSILLESADPENTKVRGNETRLAQVFDNLISNALSFSPPGRPVTIRVLTDPEEVRVVIDDEGPGIPEGKLETIFERFYTERPKHEDYGSHSGLGLSIARQIVTAHGGQIFAENTRNARGDVAGARFTVILARAQ